MYGRIVFDSLRSTIDDDIESLMKEKIVGNNSQGS